MSDDDDGLDGRRGRKRKPFPKPTERAVTKPSAKPNVSARAKPIATAKPIAATGKPTAKPSAARGNTSAKPSAAKAKASAKSAPRAKPSPPTPEHTRSSPGAIAAPRAVRPAGRRSLGPDVQVRSTPAVSNAETRAPRPGLARPPTVRLEHGTSSERDTTLAAPSERAPRPGARAATIPPRAPSAPEPAAAHETVPASPAIAPAGDHGSSAPPAIDVPDASLYEVEETIDRFFGDASAEDRDARRRATEAFAQVAAQLGGADHAGSSDGVLDGARELLRPGYYVRQWGRLGLRNRSEEVDDFGLDRAYEDRFRPIFEGLYRRWFRTSARGLENVPAEGRCLIVANHGGALPWDGLMLRTAFRLEHSARRELRWLAEDFVSHAPFLGAFVQRVGAVRACPENAERLLAQDKLVAVFPEGEKGVGKPFRERYELQRFGRGGYIKLALRTKTPIVPTAIIGSEEAHPLLFRTATLARLAGLPFLPVTPTFPWLGPLGLVPLPSRWVILCGEAIDLQDAASGRAADPDDPITVARLNDRVRGAVQDLVRRALDLRERPF